MLLTGVKHTDDGGRRRRGRLLLRWQYSGVESDGDCDGEAERQKDRETEKQNDGEERQGDRETQRQRDWECYFWTAEAIPYAIRVSSSKKFRLGNRTGASMDGDILPETAYDSVRNLFHSPCKNIVSPFHGFLNLRKLVDDFPHIMYLPK